MNVKVIEFGKGEILLEDAQGNQGWFHLAEQVQEQYIREGDATATIVDDEVTFIKMVKSEKKAPFGKTAKKSSGNFGKNRSEEPKEPEEKKFYKTKHIVLENLTGEELRAALDKASETNWVIATQTHLVEGKWHAVIYYKVKPE